MRFVIKVDSLIRGKGIYIAEDWEMAAVYARNAVVDSGAKVTIEPTEAPAPEFPPDLGALIVELTGALELCNHANPESVVWRETLAERLRRIDQWHPDGPRS